MGKGGVPMRLCLNDSGIGGPYRDLGEERIRIVHDIGYRVAGIGIDVTASDNDIAKVKDLFTRYDMEFGPGAGGTYFHRDPAVAAKTVIMLKRFSLSRGNSAVPPSVWPGEA